MIAHKYRKTSKYKYVHQNRSSLKANAGKWFAQIKKKINGVSLFWSKMCNTELEAAKAADKFLISKGLEPVNILKRK